MWTTTADHTSPATPAAIWSVWADVANWPAFDQSLAAATIDGPFAAGTTGTVTPSGQGPLRYALTAVDDGRSFSDETRLGDVAIRFHHLVRAHGEGSAVTVRVEVEGPGADDIGPMVANDLPQSLVALANEAARRG